MKLNQIMSAEFKSYFCIFGVSKHSVSKLPQKVSFNKKEQNEVCLLPKCDKSKCRFHHDFWRKNSNVRKVIIFGIDKSETTTFLK